MASLGKVSACNNSLNKKLNKSFLGLFLSLILIHVEVFKCIIGCVIYFEPASVYLFLKALCCMMIDW